MCVQEGDEGGVETSSLRAALADDRLLFARAGRPFDLRRGRLRQRRLGSFRGNHFGVYIPFRDYFAERA